MLVARSVASTAYEFSKETFKCHNKFLRDNKEINVTDKLKKYEINLIPNYGNEKIIIETVKHLKIATTGVTRPSGFAGCDVPVILDIVCSEEDRQNLNSHLDAIATDTFHIIERCPGCGNLL